MKFAFILSNVCDIIIMNMWDLQTGLPSRLGNKPLSKYHCFFVHLPTYISLPVKTHSHSSTVDSGSHLHRKLTKPTSFRLSYSLIIYILLQTFKQELIFSVHMKVAHAVIILPSMQRKCTQWQVICCIICNHGTLVTPCIMQYLLIYNSSQNVTKLPFRVPLQLKIW